MNAGLRGHSTTYLPAPSWVSMGNKAAHIKSQIVGRWNNITTKPTTDIRIGTIGALVRVCLGSGDVISVKYCLSPPGLNFWVFVGK